MGQEITAKLQNSLFQRMKDINLLCGVPQGLVLSSCVVFFKVYDHFYADDATLLLY